MTKKDIPQKKYEPINEGDIIYIVDTDKKYKVIASRRVIGTMKLVDVRKWYLKGDDTLSPTPKGVCLSDEQWSELLPRISEFLDTGSIQESKDTA